MKQKGTILNEHQIQAAKPCRKRTAQNVTKEFDCLDLMLIDSVTCTFLFHTNTVHACEVV